MYYVDYRGIVPPKQWYHDPCLQDCNGDTVTIFFAQRRIIPPKERMHNINLQNNKGQSIKSLLQDKQLPIPHHWHEDDMNQFDQACFGIIPDIKDHNPEEQDENGWTVALILSQQGIIPPQQWMHDYNIKNKYNKNIIYYLENNQLPIPQNYNNNLTIFDQACYKQIPDITNHRSDEQDQNGFTVAMILASNNIQIPPQWYHNSSIQNKYGYTVAMILANNNKLSPSVWHHNPAIINKYNQTIFEIYTIYKQQHPQWTYLPTTYQNSNKDTQAILLAKNNLSIPQQLYHDSSIQNLIIHYSDVLSSKQLNSIKLMDSRPKIKM